MPRKLRELRGDMRRAGYSIDRQSGSHEIWMHPDLPGVSVSLAGRDGADAQPYQESQVRRAVDRLRRKKRTQQ